MTLAHISDLHFGRIRDDRIVDALTEDVNAHECDVVLVTGDLTQRAYVRQFREAERWLETLAAPTLIVPGNHDVYAWWHRPDLRLLDPLRRYRQIIDREPEPYFRRADLAILGLNTAHGRTIKGGCCARGQASLVTDFFAQQSPGAFKVLAVHHPLTEVPALGRGLGVARGGQAVAKASMHAGVDLICCGHWHLSHVITKSAGGGGSVVIGLVGTATSDRWRPPQKGVNSWHAIHVTEQEFLIVVRHYVPSSGKFDIGAEYRFSRNGSKGLHTRAEK